MLIPDKPEAFSKVQKFFIVTVIAVCGLLFFADALAFNLISAPGFTGDIVVFLALGVAVSLIVALLTLVVKDIGKSGVVEEQKTDVAPVEKSSQVADIKTSVVSSVIVSEVKPGAPEQQQLPKPLILGNTERICPACRKNFYLPGYEADYIVDFGSLKQSNLMKTCPHCNASIAFKLRGTAEDVWKDNY